MFRMCLMFVCLLFAMLMLPWEEADAHGRGFSNGRGVVHHHHVGVGRAFAPHVASFSRGYGFAGYGVPALAFAPTYSYAVAPVVQAPLAPAYYAQPVVQQAPVQYAPVQQPVQYAPVQYAPVGYGGGCSQLIPGAGFSYQRAFGSGY